jgi:hypothetical protein
MSHIGSTVAGTTNEQWVDIRADSVLTIMYQVRSAASKDTVKTFPPGTPVPRRNQCAVINRVEQLATPECNTACLHIIQACRQLYRNPAMVSTSILMFPCNAPCLPCRG